jgi:hypothetical protein
LALRAVQNGLSDTDVKDTAFCQANVLAPFLNQIETFRRSCFERLKQIEEPTSDHVERIFLSEKLGLGKDQSRRVRKESAQELAQLCKQFVDEIFPTKSGESSSHSPSLTCSIMCGGANIGRSTAGSRSPK